MLSYTENTEKRKNKITLFAILLAIYFSIIVFDIFSIGSMGALLKLFAVGILCVWIFYISKISIRLDATLGFEVCFLLMCVASAAYSIDYEASKTAITSLALNFGLIMFCGAFVFNRREAALLEKSMVIGSVGVAFAAILFSDLSRYSGRLSINILGDVADPNYVNGYLIFALSFFVYHLINTKKFKLICFAATGGIIVFTLLTGSRGALLTQIAVIIAIWFFSVRKENKKVGLIFLGIVLAIALFSFFVFAVSLLPDEVAERFSLDFIKDGGASGRFDIWEALLTRYIGDDIFTIFFGTGIGTTPAYNTLKPAVAHNIFLEMLIGTGIVGLLFYIGIFISFFAKAYKSNNVIAMGAIIGMVVLGMSLSTYMFKPMFSVFLYTDIYHRAFLANGDVGFDKKQNS